MFSLVSFTGLWTYGRQTHKGAVAVRQGTGAGEPSEEYYPQSELPEDYDPATVHDLSYEDALLDARVRRFMSEEYGSIEPPRGVFQRLVKLLNGQQDREQVASLPARVMVRVYRAVGGLTFSRLVPSGIAVALLIVVGIGSSTTSLLRTEKIMVGAESTPVVEQGLGIDTVYVSAPFQAQQTWTQARGQAIRDVTGGEEAYVIVNGRDTMNLPLESRGGRETQAPKYNRLMLDPF